MNTNLCPHCGGDVELGDECEKTACCLARGDQPHPEAVREYHVPAEGCRLLLGYQTVYLSKEFGPTIFADLRIKPSLERGGWVIERMTGPKDEWKEQIVIPAQLDEDFEEQEL